MIYTLYVWAVIAMAGDRHYQAKEYGWKVVGEFYDSSQPPQMALEKCQRAALELGLKDYRCVRAK